MSYKSEEQKIKAALDQEAEIPEQILNRVQETYRELGLTEDTVIANREERSHMANVDTKIVPLKRHHHFRPMKYLLVAALTLLAVGTVYAVQSSIISRYAQENRENYESFDEKDYQRAEGESEEEFQTRLEESKEEFKQKAERYEKIEKKSDKEMTLISLSELIGNSVVKEESYYDGSDFALVVSLESVREPIQYGFGPDHEKFEYLWCSALNSLQDIEKILKDDSLSKEDREFYQELYKSKKESTANYDGKFDEQLELCIGNRLITEDEAAKLKEIYEEQGSVGFIANDIYIGDHVLLPDGTDLTVSEMTYESDIYVIEPFEGVTPDTVWNLDALDMVLQVKRGSSYHYIDEDANYFCYYENDEVEQVTVTLENVNK